MSVVNSKNNNNNDVGSELNVGKFGRECDMIGILAFE
jgi:hypothetical protein